MPPNSPNQPFDVFLSHNSKDKPAVEKLAMRLIDDVQLNVWLDKWNLIPGEPWQEEIERALDQAHTCAVFLGPSGFGGWHHEEMRNALDQRVGDRERKFRVIPVLLPGAVMPERSKLPSFLSRLTWVDFRNGLDDEEAFRRLVAGIRGIAPGRPDSSPTPVNVECPYRGLEVFDEEHARFFFGREAMTQHLVEALRPTRFLCVLGPSGSGKSSLARAGLLPQLRAGKLPGSQHWQYVVFKPGAHPIEELALNLAALQTAQDQVSAAAELINNFKTTETALHLFARLLLKPLRAQPDEARLFLLVDQFEEVFTLCQDAAERLQFIKNIRYAGTIDGGRVVIVPTMRADFLTRAAESPDLAELLSTHQFIVNPMEPDELRRAIEEPARLAGLRFEPGLVERILSDVGHEPGALPLLEHALRELFEKRSSENVMTAQAYEQSGGVQGALAQKAEAIYARFTPEQQTILRRVMLRLTQPGEGTADTRRRAAKNELWSKPEEQDAVEKVIAVLAKKEARLITTSRDVNGEEQLDVAHEALIRGWPRLGNWINDDREGLRLRHQLSEDTKEWRKRGKDESYLYQGARLEQAVEWWLSNEAELNVLEKEFLEEGVKARTVKFTDEQVYKGVVQRVKWLRVWLKVLAWSALVIVATMVPLGVYSFLNWKQLRSEVYKNDMYRASELFSTGDYSRSMQLLVRHIPTSDSWHNFLETDLRDERWHNLWQSSHDEKTTLEEHTSSVFSVAFTPDGKTLLSIGADGSVRFWDVDTGRETGMLEILSFLAPHAVIAPDGKTLAVANFSRISLWNMATKEELPPFRKSLLFEWVSIRSATFSADSKTIASIGDDNVALWDVTAREGLFILKEGSRESKPDGLDNQKSVFFSERENDTAGDWSVAFAPNGKMLATVSNDSEIKLWDVASKKEIGTLKGHSAAIRCVCFAPDGKTIATASDDKTIKFWDVTKRQELGTLKRHSASVRSVAYSPDGKTISSASRDWTVKLWEVGSGKELTTFKGHTDAVNSVAFSPDGKMLASGSNDKTIKLWVIPAFMVEKTQQGK